MAEARPTSSIRTTQTLKGLMSLDIKDEEPNSHWREALRRNLGLGAGEHDRGAAVPDVSVQFWVGQRCDQLGAVRVVLRLVRRELGRRG
jgi:hypothetical protein